MRHDEGGLGRRHAEARRGAVTRILARRELVLRDVEAHAPAVARLFDLREGEMGPACALIGRWVDDTCPDEEFDVRGEHISVSVMPESCIRVPLQREMARRERHERFIVIYGHPPVVARLNVDAFRLALAWRQAITFDAAGSIEDACLDALRGLAPADRARLLPPRVSADQFRFGDWPSGPLFGFRG